MTASVDLKKVLSRCVVAACLVLASAAPPAVAKKKGGKTKLGPVVTGVGTATVTNPAPILNPVTATATCPGKRVAVGGGFLTSTSAPENFVIVYASFRVSNNSWASNAVGYPGGTLTTYVYCRKLKKPPSEVAGAVTTSPGDFAAATATASCPRKTTLLSGGFSSTQGPTGFDFAKVTTAINRGGTWTYTATNNSDLTETLTGYAYCAKGVKAPELATGSNSGGATPGGGTVSASAASCSRRQLSAGGFSGSPSVALGPTPYVIKSQIDGSAWSATTMNSGIPGPVSLETQGICF